MRQNKAITIAAALLSAGIWAGAYVSAHQAPSLDTRPHEAVGWMMARQAAGLLKGGQISVIARDTSAFENPASDVQLGAFQKELRKSRLSIGSLHLLQVDPLRPVEVPPGDFTEIMRKSPPGSVIVSFMGPPAVAESQQSLLGAAKPAIIALCSGNVPERFDLKALFEQGLLQVAVLNRRDAKIFSPEPRDLQSRFDHWFVAVTASEAATLPAAAQQEQ
jgi:hypothetical protein